MRPGARACGRSKTALRITPAFPSHIVWIYMCVDRHIWSPQLEHVILSLSCFLAFVEIKIITMCGVIGLSYADPKKDVAGELVEGSILLQHRGQDACGFAVQGAVDRFGVAKGKGLVMDFLQSESRSINNLRGSEGIGHGQSSPLKLFPYSGLIVNIVRYPTNDNHAESQIQPIVLDDYRRTSLSHVCAVSATS